MQYSTEARDRNSRADTLPFNVGEEERGGERSEAKREMGICVHYLRVSAFAQIALPEIHDFHEPHLYSCETILEIELRCKRRGLLQKHYGCRSTMLSDFGRRSFKDGRKGNRRTLHNFSLSLLAFHPVEDVGIYQAIQNCRANVEMIE